MCGLRGPWRLDMVNQALRMKIAYWSKKKEKEEEEEENTKDRLVPDGSDNYS